MGLDTLMNEQPNGHRKLNHMKSLLPKINTSRDPHPQTQKARPQLQPNPILNLSSSGSFVSNDDCSSNPNSTTSTSPPTALAHSQFRSQTPTQHRTPMDVVVTSLINPDKFIHWIDTYPQSVVERFCEKLFETRYDLIAHRVGGVVDMMMHQNGHAVVTRAMEVCSHELRMSLVEPMSSALDVLSTGVFSSNCVVRFVQILASTKQRGAFLALQRMFESTSVLYHLVLNKNGGHVLEVLAYALGEHFNGFLLQYFAQNCVFFGKRRIACHVVQNCARFAAEKDLRELCRAVVSNVRELITNIFGAALVQFVLGFNSTEEHRGQRGLYPTGSPEIIKLVREQILKHFNIAELCVHRVSSFIIQDLLRASPRWIEIVEAILSLAGTLMEDALGRVCVHEALSIATDSQRGEFLERTRLQLTGELNDDLYGAETIHPHGRRSNSYAYEEGVALPGIVREFVETMPPGMVIPASVVAMLVQQQSHSDQTPHQHSQKYSHQKFQTLSEVQLRGQRFSLQAQPEAVACVAPVGGVPDEAHNTTSKSATRPAPIGRANVLTPQNDGSSNFFQLHHIKSWVSPLCGCVSAEAKPSFQMGVDLGVCVKLPADELFSEIEARNNLD